MSSPRRSSFAVSLSAAPAKMGLRRLTRPFKRWPVRGRTNVAWRSYTRVRRFLLRGFWGSWGLCGSSLARLLTMTYLRSQQTAGDGATRSSRRRRHCGGSSWARPHCEKDIVSSALGDSLFLWTPQSCRTRLVLACLHVCWLARLERLREARRCCHGGWAIATLCPILYSIYYTVTTV